MSETRSDGLVFFGATGDLAAKQVFPALQAMAKKGELEIPIVAVGRKDIGADGIRAKAKEALEKDGQLDRDAFERLAKVLDYVAVDYDRPESFDKIVKALKGAKHPLHYVALPPEIFERVGALLAKAGLAKGARLALEKPFGNDLASAKALSAALAPSFPEEALYRIDHFLGKEAVENLVYLRATNPLVERALDRRSVASIQITMAETFGVGGRAEFYDKVGAVRDVVQNHLLEVLACLTMELPTERGHTALRAARAKLLSAVRTMSKDDLVRGQARAYLAEKGVAKGSTTETFAAVKLAIDSPRWEEVPIFVRAGKYLPVTATEAVIRFKATDHAVLEDASAPSPNHLRLQIGPKSLITLGMNVKKGGEAMAGERAELALCRTPKDALKPYERLLGDAMRGDPTLFASRDAVFESWRVVDTALKAKTPAHAYDEKTWGPKEAERLTPPGGWLLPRIEDCD